MSRIDSETVHSTARVLNRVIESEGDSDHIQTLEDALDRLWKLHDGVPFHVDTSDVTAEDTEVAYRFLNENSPSQSEKDNYRQNHGGDRHPDRVFGYVIDFVDHNSRYVHGCLPSFRDWDVSYVEDGDIIEERTYNHDDEIPLDPEINGIRYDSERTKRGSDGEVTVHVSKDPVRNDVDVVVNAEGSDFINLEAHDGPNVKDGESAIDELESRFNWGMLGDTEIIIKDDPNNVIEFFEEEGWEYER